MSYRRITVESAVQCVFISVPITVLFHMHYVLSAIVGAVGGGGGRVVKPC